MKKRPFKLPGNARRKSTVPPAHLKIRNILATTDLSKESIAGVRYAVALAEKAGAAVALLHVAEFPTPPPMPGMRTTTFSLQDSEISRRARVRLKSLARRESKGDLNLTPVLRSGNPLYGIITAARERASDLIVIGTRGYTGAKRVLLGSTAERVVRHALCPVLTVPARTTPERTSKMPLLDLKKILVPIDFSKTSKAALPWAASLATDSGSQLILLHVMEKFPIDYVLGRDLMNEWLTPFMKQAEAELEIIAGKLNKSQALDTSAIVRGGKPFREICNVARILGAGLIVLTTRGYTGLKNVWLGSTAERVVRHAPCPVLTVRKAARASDDHGHNRRTT